MENLPLDAEYANDDGSVWWIDAQQILLRAYGKSLIDFGLNSARQDPDAHFEEIASLAIQISKSISYFDPIRIELTDGTGHREVDQNEIAETLAMFGQTFLINALKYKNLNDVYGDAELVSLMRKESPRFYPRLMEFQMRDSMYGQFEHGVLLSTYAAEAGSKFLDWAPPSLSGGPDENVSQKPLPQPYGVSHEGAETLVRDWMLYMGMSSAEVTRISGDGGIDVTAHGYVAQVKNYRDQVGVQSVREILGVAVAEGKKPLFFTSGTYTSEALLFAEKAGVPLFIYDAAAGTLSNVNDGAEQVYAARNNVSPDEILAEIKSTLWIYRQTTRFLQGATRTLSRFLNTLFPNNEDKVSSVKESLDALEESLVEMRDSWLQDDEANSAEVAMELLNSARNRFIKLVEVHRQILQIAGMDLVE